MKKSVLYSAAVASLGLAVSANAAVLTVTSSVTQMTDMNATTGSSSNAILIAAALHGTVAHDFKITYYIQVTGDTGNEEGFGNMSANVALGSSVVRSTNGGHKNYLASGAMANSYSSPSLVFSQQDSDAGSNTTDLQGIIVALPAGLDPADGSADDSVRQFQLAAVNDAPVAIGSVWVAYNGTTTAALTTLTVTQWSTSNGDPTTLVVTGDPINQAAGISIGLVPEPASLSLLGLGAMGLIARRRRA